AQEEAVARERHRAPVSAQSQQVQQARENRELRASANRGKPPIAATERAGNFRGAGVVAARAGENYNPPPNRGRGNNPERHRRPANENNRPPNSVNDNRPPNARTETRPPSARGSDRPTYVHPKDLPPVSRSDRPNTGNPKTDQKYQQQQDR